MLHGWLRTTSETTIADESFAPEIRKSNLLMQGWLRVGVALLMPGARDNTCIRLSGPPQVLVSFEQLLQAK